MRTRRVAIAGASVLAAAALTGGAVYAFDMGDAHADSFGIEATPLGIEFDGLFKPNSEMMISANCPVPDASAKLVTSFGAESEMTPAADSGQLIGLVTAPNNIGPGPDEGHHTVTVTCESGAFDTARFLDDGNGTDASAK